MFWHFLVQMNPAYIATFCFFFFYCIPYQSLWRVSHQNLSRAVDLIDSGYYSLEEWSILSQHRYLHRITQIRTTTDRHLSPEWDLNPYSPVFERAKALHDFNCAASVTLCSSISHRSYQLQYRIEKKCFHFELKYKLSSCWVLAQTLNEYQANIIGK